MIGKLEQITEEDVISAAKFKLRKTETTNFDDYFSFLIQEGARHLGALSLFKKQQCELEIIDGKTELPKGFYRMIGLRFFRNHPAPPIVDGQPFLLTHGCLPMLYVDRPFLHSCGCNTVMGGVSPFIGTFQIIGNFIHYNSSVRETHVTISYLGFNLNKEGRMIIYADYERALTAYCCYNFALSYSEEFKEATIERWHQEWLAQKNWVKGLDASHDFQQRKAEVQEIFSALLVSNTVNYTNG